MGSPAASTARWIVVIGASAGGVDGLRRFVAELPERLDAAVAVVLHVSPTSPSVLPDILGRASRLPVAPACDGAPVRPGHIVVCPPDVHLAVADGHYRLRGGATENGARPAVDVLFRTAAGEFGPTCIGVVLSGARDDGAAGLAAVRAAGGVTMVQDPADATYPSMPTAAIARVGTVDVVGLPEDLARRVPAVVATPGGAGVDPPVGRAAAIPDDDVRLLPARYSCPECGGPLEEAGGLGRADFRCHVGHRWNEAALEARQTTQVEQALWTALRIIDERLALTLRMRARARANAQHHVEAGLSERLVELRRDAETIRSMLDAAPLEPRAVPLVGGGPR